MSTIDLARNSNQTYITWQWGRAAPDVSPPREDAITVEGGLEMEQGLHIPVPLFGSLEVLGNESFEEEATNNNDQLEPCIEIDDNMPDVPPCIEIDDNMLDVPVEVGNTTPVDRTASPLTTGKKIPATFEETRFRKEFYNNIYERVKLFRLHCTICEKHLGCAPWLTERQMRNHKLLSVPVCRKCFEFYGDINFPIEDGSEIYCCWCGQGGEVFCCAKCPKTVCKKCIGQNFGERKIKVIDENDNWICFVCNPTDIYPHRAILWGLQRYSKEMRQKVAFLEREEKQAKLSKDTSHCCPLENEECPTISLPFKVIMAKIPLCLIAHPHRKAVLNQKDHPQQRHFTIPTMNNKQIPRHNLIAQNGPGPITTLLKNHLNGQSLLIQGQQINRFAPYPAPRQVNPRPEILPSVRSSTVNHMPNRSDTVVNTYRNQPVMNYVPMQTNQTDIDIEWLENGISDVNNTINVIKRMVDHFITSKDYLKGDATKLSSFSEQFSHNIKIAICSLAKANQTMLDARKVVFDNQVNFIVNTIKASVTNVPINQKPPTPQPPPPATDTSQTDEEVNDLPSLNAALLCETVMEVEGNKENENGNKNPRSPVRRTPPKPKSLQKRRLKITNFRKRLSQKQSPQKAIPVIDLIDDDEEDSIDDSYYLKKYNIKPCKVVLKRCK